MLEQIQRWTTHPDKPLSDIARRFLVRDGFAMIEPPPPVNPLKTDGFGEWEPELHKLLKAAGYEVPEMYCLSDKVESKYLQPYTEEKEPKNQSAVNTTRVIVEGEPVAVGDHMPRLAVVIAKAQDRIAYYVPKEIRGAALQLSRRLRDSAES